MPIALHAPEKNYTVVHRGNIDKKLELPFCVEFYTKLDINEDQHCITFYHSLKEIPDFINRTSFINLLFSIYLKQGKPEIRLIWDYNNIFSGEEVHVNKTFSFGKSISKWGEWTMLAFFFYEKDGKMLCDFFTDGLLLETLILDITSHEFPRPDKTRYQIGSIDAWDFSFNKILNIPFNGSLTELRVWSRIPRYTSQLRWPVTVDSKGLILYIPMWKNVEGYKREWGTWIDDPIYDPLPEAILNHSEGFPAFNTEEEKKCVDHILSVLKEYDLIAQDIMTLEQYRDIYVIDNKEFGSISSRIDKVTSDTLDPMIFKKVKDQLFDESHACEKVYNTRYDLLFFIDEYDRNVTYAFDKCLEVGFAPSDDSKEIKISKDSLVELAISLAKLLLEPSNTSYKGEEDNKWGKRAMGVSASVFRFIIDHRHESITEAIKLDAELIEEEFATLKKGLLDWYNQKNGSVKTNCEGICQNWGMMKAILKYPHEVPSIFHIIRFTN